MEGGRQARREGVRDGSCETLWGVRALTETEKPPALMRILLESHVFVWAKCAPELLSDRARTAIIDPDNGVFVSVASAWELWIKHARKSIPGFGSVLASGSSFLAAARES